MSSNDNATAVCTMRDSSACRGTQYCPPRCPRFESKTGMPMLVRPYESDDRGTLAWMYDEFDWYSRSMGLPPYTLSRIDAWLEGLLSRGWSLVAVIPSDATDRRSKFLIFVHPEYQNDGVGSEMFKQLVAYADEQDDDELALEVSTGSDRAIAVYRNVGFEAIERWTAELAMKLELRRPLTRRVRRPPAERD